MSDKRDYVKIIHFIRFQSPDFVTICSILSAIDVNKDWEVRVYTESKYVECWQKLSISGLNVFDIEIFEGELRGTGFPALDLIDKASDIYERYRIKSDILRLYILLKYGGLYIDTDIIFVKPFPEDLLLMSARTRTMLLSEETFEQFPSQRVVTCLTNAFIYTPFPSFFLLRHLLEGWNPETSYWKGLRYSDGTYKIGTVEFSYEDYIYEIGIRYLYFLQSAVYPNSVFRIPWREVYYPSAADIVLYTAEGNYKTDFPEAFVFHLWMSIWRSTYNVSFEQFIDENPKSVIASILLPYKDKAKEVLKDA